MVKWFRALDLKSGDPSVVQILHPIPLSGSVLGGPEFDSLMAWCNLSQQTVQPPTSWDL